MIRHRFIKLIPALLVAASFFAGCGRKESDAHKEGDGHDHGAEKTEGKEGGHGHEEESPSGASFKPGKGVMLTEDAEDSRPSDRRGDGAKAARQVAIQCADFWRGASPRTPRSRPRRVRRAWFGLSFTRQGCDCPRGIARGSSNALKRRVSRRGARRASRTGHR